MLLPLLWSLRAPGSALNIVSPREAETLRARGDGEGINVRIDLGEDVRVPEHGVLALYVDDARVLLACPDRVKSASECPTPGAALSGEISLGLGNMQPGEHALTVELLDASLAPLMLAQRVFTFLPASDEDDSLPEDAPAFNMIVFSKDRACQLDQLLSSMRTHIRNVLTPFVRLQVLYYHSTSKFADGYKAVVKLHPGVRFHQQGNLSSNVTSSYYSAFASAGGPRDGFKADYLRLLDDSIPYTLHFMDDMLMTDTWDVREQLLTHRVLSSRPEVIAMSLRLHPGISRCYATNEDTPPPTMDAEMTWRWPDAKGDWSYPMSLDAHVFRSEEISRLALNLDYHNPNTLEGSLAMYCFQDLSEGRGQCQTRLACFKRGKVINIPANRVQDTFPNRYMAGGLSAELLNTEFLFNRRLTSEHHWQRVYDSVHVAQPLIFAVGTLQHEMAELLYDPDRKDDL